MSSLQKILDTIKKADSGELDRVHADVLEKNQNASPEEKIASIDFEVDDKLHKVPFRTLREYLQTGKATPSESQLPEMRRRFLNRIPMQVGSDSDLKEKPRSSDDGYYWDTNTNYEYMNPEASKDKVLGKIRK